MELNDKLFYTKGSASWYQKSFDHFSFTSRPQCVDGKIVIQETFPYIIENARRHIVITLSRADVEAMRLLLESQSPTSNPPAPGSSPDHPNLSPDVSPG